jgi:hypothetical protein
LGQIFEISDRAGVGQKSEFFDRPGVAETEILELAKNFNGQRTLFRKLRHNETFSSAIKFKLGNKLRF